MHGSEESLRSVIDQPFEYSSPEHSPLYLAIDMSLADDAVLQMLESFPNAANAVVHVKPGGQSDAAGIVVGSRLVGVNGDGVSNRPASSDNDPYRLLGVAKDADESAIRKAYKKTSLKTHPDRGGRKSLFVAVNKAYAVLADEQTRRDYDTCADSVDFDKAMTLIKNSPRPLTLQLVRPVEKEPEDEEEDEEEST